MAYKFISINQFFKKENKNGGFFKIRKKLKMETILLGNSSAQTWGKEKS